MCVTTTDNDEQIASEMTAAKPKERQFQVVPVPGTFTRGRWKCWDYKDQTSGTGTIIDFTDKSEKHPLSINIGENPVGCRTFIPHGQTDIMNHTSESHLITATDTSSAAISQAIDISNGRKESSTIVVTSIAPPSATPVHGTPSSASISPVINNAAAIEIKGKIPDHENLLPLHSTASTPVLNVGGVASIHTHQIYRTPSAASYLQPLSELPDSNPVVQSSFAPEPAVTNVPLIASETEDP
uniref:Uncharacterized protein n=1 Tax=Onchocerca volvulus TaxID=6282 RepID=A0A8R1TSP5_ONCVO